MCDLYTGNWKFVRQKSFASLGFGFIEGHFVEAIVGNRNWYMLQIVILNTETVIYFLTTQTWHP